MRRQKQQANLQDQCDRFNAKCPVGSVVTVTDDFGEKNITRTKSEAYLMCGSAVVMLDGISGCYDLDRVSAD